jgi:hypothetical protein
VLRHERLLRAGLLAVLAGWAVWSLASAPPLDRPLPPKDATGPLVAFAVAGGELYAFAAWRYLALYRRRHGFLLVAITVAWILLTEAVIAVAFARNWHATWWEWHVLMSAFVLVAAAVRHEYRRGARSRRRSGTTPCWRASGSSSARAGRSPSVPSPLRGPADQAARRACAPSASTRVTRARRGAR